MGAARMKNDYVVHDQNSSWMGGEKSWNKDRRAEVIAMSDGAVMYEGAFGGSFPMNNYTPQELGMKTDGTPFAQQGGIPQKAPHTYNSNQPISINPSPPTTTPPQQEFSAENTQTGEKDIPGNEVKPKLQIVSDFNDWASNNVGSLFMGLLAAYGIFRLGVWSANKQS